MRLIFMGRPEFAVPSLDALARSSHEVIEVVTQPDRPSGRGLKLRPSAVAVEAERHGIVVSKPEKFRAAEFVDHLRSLALPFGMLVAVEEAIGHVVGPNDSTAHQPGNLLTGTGHSQHITGQDRLASL